MAGLEVAKLYARISADVSDFSKGMDKVKDELNFAQKGMSGLQSAVGAGLKVAAGIGVAAVGGLATGIGVATGKAMDMEQSIADISAAMQLSSEETGELKDLIMDLGLDPKLKVSAVEAAQAIQVLGTAGLSMDEILQGAARSTVLLANSTGADFANAAEIASDVMAQFNIKAEDMDAMVNQIVGTTVASKMTIQEYGLAIGQVGGTAATLGMSFEDLNAVLASTASSFGGGTNSATALKTMLTRLVPSSNEAKDVMESLELITTDYARMAEYLSSVLGKQVEPSVQGVYEAFKQTKTGTDAAAVSEEALAKAFAGLRVQFQENEFFDDSTGAMKDVDEIAGLLQRTLGNLTEEQRNQAGATIFGVDAMNMAFALMKGGTPVIQEMKDVIGDTSAEESAATRMDTLRGSWEIFQGVVETLTLGIGDKFLPIARQMTEWATELAQKYGPKLIEWAEKASDAFMDVVDWMVEWVETGDMLNEKLTALPKPIRDVVEGVAKFIDKVKIALDWVVDLNDGFLEWQDVMTAVGLVVASIVLPALGSILVAAAPVVAIFAALVLGVAALRTAWETDFGGIRTKTGEVLGYIDTTFGDLFATIQQFGGDALQEIVDWAKGNETEFTAVKTIWESAKDAFGKAFGDMGAKLKEWGATVWTEFKERFPGAAATLQGAVESISAKFKELWAAIEPLIDSLVEAYQKMVDRWTQNSTDVTDALDEARTVMDDIFTIIITLVETSVGLLIDSLTLVAQLLTGDWAGAWQTATTIVTDLWNGLVDILTAGFDIILQAFGSNIADFTAWKDRTIGILLGWKDNALSNVNTFVEDTRNKIDTWRTNVVNLFTTFKGNVTATMESIRLAIVTPFQTAMETTRNAVSTWRDQVAGLVERLRDNILAHMAAVRANVIDPVKQFIVDTQERIDIWKTWIIERWQAIKDAAIEKWTAIKLAIVEPVSNFVSAVIEKVTSWKDWLVQKFADIWTGIQTAFHKAGEWVKWGRDLIQGLWDGFKEKWEAFGNWWRMAWDALVRRFKDFFGIGSPSTLFRGYGEDMMDGLQGGVDTGMPAVRDAFDSIGPAISDVLTGVVGTITTHGTTLMGYVSGFIDESALWVKTSIDNGVEMWRNTIDGSLRPVLKEYKDMTADFAAQEARLKAASDAQIAALRAADSAAYTEYQKIKREQEAVRLQAELGYRIVYPTTPTAPPAPPPAPPPPPPFDTLKTGAALVDALGLSTAFNAYNPELSAFYSNVRTFAETVKGMIPQWQATQAETQAASTLIFDPASKRIDELLAAVQVLIQTIITRGLSNQVNISEAPVAATENRQELIDLVAYLNALYAG